MDNNKSFVLPTLLAVLVIGFAFWSIVFRTQGQGPTRTKIDHSYTDQLSGEKVSTQQINGIQFTNPNAPYFVGFDKLSYYGVSQDDARYIKDFIINYLLYTKHIDSASVSLVKNSFRGPFLEQQGYIQQYGFKFGINGADIHTIQVASDSRGPTVDIKILVGAKVVAHKKFQVYYL